MCAFEGERGFGGSGAAVREVHGHARLALPAAPQATSPGAFRLAKPVGTQFAQSQDPTVVPAHSDLTPSTQRIETVRRIAREVAAPASGLVDRDARFPSEALDAVRTARLLSAYLPVALGGYGGSVEELGTMCRFLGEAYASTAMVFAMHQAAGTAPGFGARDANASPKVGSGSPSLHAS